MMWFRKAGEHGNADGVRGQEGREDTGRRHRRRASAQRREPLHGSKRGGPSRTRLLHGLVGVERAVTEIPLAA